MIDLVGVIHQTRLVSRVCLFEVENLNLVASHDVEIHPESPGIDPTKIVDSFFECLEQVAQKIRDLGYSIDSIKSKIIKSGLYNNNIKGFIIDSDRFGQREKYCVCLGQEYKSGFMSRIRLFRF